MSASSSEEPQGPLGGLVGEAIEAVEDELVALSRDPATTIDLRDGRPKGAVGADRLWSFEFDGHLPVQPETPAGLFIKGREPISATILSVGDFNLVLGVSEELGEHVGRARLTLKPWFIYRALQERLDELRQGPADVGLAQAIFEPSFDVDDSAEDEPVSFSAGGLGPGQVEAVESALRPGLRFVWGPPGTGKTTTLAATVKARAERGDSVLIVSTSNAAIDVAMVRVAERMEGMDLLENGHVLRVGIPQLEDAQACHKVLPDKIIGCHQPELLERRDRLEAERRQLSNQLQKANSTRQERALGLRLDEVRQELDEIENRFREARAELIRNARVVGTTLAKCVVDNILWRWKADAVVVDEASMAGLPYLLALALRGATTFACFGDFRQLPPIGLSNRASTKEWFQQDVFEKAGVVERVMNGESDPRLATLHMQYRMGEEIADTVSRLAYFEMLRTHPDAEEAASLVAQVPPVSGAQVVVVDTSDLAGACMREADPRSYSRFNAVAAALSTTLAQDLVFNGVKHVGVVSPYRAQARLLASLTNRDSGVTAATVHKFQGGERDAMVIDLTDSFPQTGPSQLTGRDLDKTMRVINVAMSRAKGKLVLCADLEFIFDKSPSSSPVLQALEKLLELRDPVPVSDLVQAGLSSPPLAWYENWSDAASMLWDSGFDPSTRVDVSVPSVEFSGEWLNVLVEGQVASGGRMTLRAPAQVARCYDSSGIELRLQTLGDGAVIFAGKHRTVIAGRRADASACVVEGAAPNAALSRLLLPTETG